MTDAITFPETVDEFMEKYKIVDSDEVYTNGAELVPIFRMKQWFEHSEKHGRWIALGDKSPWPAFHDDAVQCSACKFKYMRLMPRNYCPNCGADMREVTE